MCVGGSLVSGTPPRSGVKSSGQVMIAGEVTAQLGVGWEWRGRNAAQRVVLGLAPGDRVGWLPAIAINYLTSDHTRLTPLQSSVLRSVAPRSLNFSVLTYYCARHVLRSKKPVFKA